MTSFTVTLDQGGTAEPFADKSKILLSPVNQGLLDSNGK